MSNGVDFRKLALDLRAQLTTAQSELTRKDEAYQGAHMMCQDLKRELAALREELAIIKDECIDHVNLHKEWTKQRDDMQQRLTAAEQRNSVRRGLLHRALNVIRGMRYDELEAAIVEELNIPTESGASE